MAHFYGTLKGNRGQASRLGTKNSGLDVTAASWEGSVRVLLFHHDGDGRDYARVTLSPWKGHGKYRLLYEGPVSGVRT